MRPRRRSRRDWRRTKRVLRRKRRTRRVLRRKLLGDDQRWTWEARGLVLRSWMSPQQVWMTAVKFYLRHS